MILNCRPEFDLARVLLKVWAKKRALWGAEHILIITDPGIVKAGIVDRILEALKEEGYENTEIFDGVEPNPRDTTVHKAYEWQNLWERIY